MKRIGILIFFALMICKAQAQYMISGQVRAATGEPLQGANVVLHGANRFASTDDTGHFRLEVVPKGVYTLRITYVGFKEYKEEVFVDSHLNLTVEMDINVFQGEEVIVYATRANEKTPTTHSSISNEEIEKRNLGQDLPFVLRYTPSVVVTSDAGTGVGYTGIRIRGTDPTRINVTVNGIPINDSESHGTFWVNMPDFASSVNNIQIQRGVGTSTNGAAAFGATINLQTSLPETEAFAQVDNSFGSFNTRKHTIIYNTGLLNEKWSFEGRLSKIASDGYIDRASSDLSSYYLSGGYYGKKTTIKALTFAGKEITYQSWWGTPESRLENDSEGMEEVITNNGYTEAQAENLRNSGRTFNYYLYENEVDNYQQDHYQLHMNHAFGPSFNVSLSGHYTYGRGYYEQYREEDDLAAYQLADLTIGDSVITTTDLIRRRWLDNHFYGGVFSANYQTEKWTVILGGGYNYYDGDHFGEIIWARFASGSEIKDRYYDNYGRKNDGNIYLKINYQLSQKLNVFADGQVRHVEYGTKGIDSDLRAIDTGGDYTFLNPKIGATYTLNERANLYASYAVGNREPVRTDFIDAPNGQTPKPETLRNLEVGYRRSTARSMMSVNYYWMNYRNQLVLTGELNDVGSALRTNVPESYRTGLELVGGVRIIRNLNWSANLTLSQNKIAAFSDIIYDYGVNWDEYNEVRTEYKNIDISFSPSVIAGSQLSYLPFRNFEITLLNKYVGKQYLDNTSDEDRSIAPYFISDLKLDYQFKMQAVQTIKIALLINNLTNQRYESNGYTFGYRAGDYVVRENYYYPQAGTNFLASVSLMF